MPRADGSALALSVFEPAERTNERGAKGSTAPIVAWIHGGGFAVGAPLQDFGFIDRRPIAVGGGSAGGNLCAVGVATDFREFPSCYHGFDIVCPGSSPAREAAAFLMESFRRNCPPMD